MTSTAHPLAIGPSTVLADVFPHLRARSAILVVTGALLVAAASQVRIPLGFTPVPINGGTFAVMVVGTSLGMRRGGAALALYLLAGIAGLPFFVDGGSGLAHITGATGGYLIAYLMSALMLGALAERGSDRRVATAVPAMLAATLTIYVLGAAWLAYKLGLPLFGRSGSAWSMGIEPFLLGDAVKLALAGVALPAAWRVVGEA